MRETSSGPCRISGSRLCSSWTRNAANALVPSFVRSVSRSIAVSGPLKLEMMAEISGSVPTPASSATVPGTLNAASSFVSAWAARPSQSMTPVAAAASMAAQPTTSASWSPSLASSSWIATSKPVVVTLRVLETAQSSPLSVWSWTSTTGVPSKASPNATLVKLFVDRRRPRPPGRGG